MDNDKELQLNADDIPVLDPETLDAPDLKPAAETPPPAEAEPDWRKVDEELRARGAGFSLKDAPKHFLDLQRGITKANDRASKFKPYEPLIDYLAKNPQAAERVYATLNETMDTVPGLEPDTAAAVRSALDPVQRELYETRQWRLQQQMQSDMQKVRDEFKDVFDFTDDVGNEVLTDCIASGDYNIRRVFLDRHAGDILSRARAKGKQETVETIQKRNEGYTPVSGPVPIGPAEIPDFSKLSPAEQDAEMDRVLDRIWADKKLAKQIASEVSG